MSNEFTFIVDEDRKYTLVKYLSLQEIIDKGPCAEALVDFIKAFPKEILMLEIDPEDLYSTYHSNNFKKFMKLITKDDKWYDVIDFLDSSGFIEWDDLTEEEWNRYWKNKNRRDARARAKKKMKK